MSAKPRKLVQIFFPFKVVDEIDEAVKKGTYESRSHFIRSAVRQKLTREK